VIETSLLAALGATESEPAGRRFGVVVGVVTNNQDPEGMGRVKVKLPWLSAEDESHWARIASPSRGFCFLPEVEDEVLVAFEQGRVEFPYILGALWNGKDKPPTKNDDGKNNLRTLTSRSGHTVTLDDTDGSERIEITDAEGKQSIVFDTVASTLTITADKDVVIESKNGALKLSGKQGIEITSADGPGKIQTKQNLDAKSDAQVNVKGSVINLN
jgi:uncharacterized protein involved in type VI secretion and phage assembly